MHDPITFDPHAPRNHGEALMALGEIRGWLVGIKEPLAIGDVRRLEVAITNCAVVLAGSADAPVAATLRRGDVALLVPPIHLTEKQAGNQRAVLRAAGIDAVFLPPGTTVAGVVAAADGAG